MFVYIEGMWRKKDMSIEDGHKENFFKNDVRKEELYKNKCILMQVGYA